MALSSANYWATLAKMSGVSISKMISGTITAHVNPVPEVRMWTDKVTMTFHIELRTKHLGNYHSVVSLYDSLLRR